MKVPLSASRITINDRQKIKIWANGKKKIIDAPFRPYFYTDMPVQTEAEDIEKVTGTRLSDSTKRTFYKHNFTVVDDVPRNRIPGRTYEDNIPFIIRVRIDEPDFFLQYPNDNDLSYLMLDIEQDSEPGTPFPTINDKLTNIAYCTQKNRKIQSLNIKSQNSSDKGMIEYFAEVVEDVNPDIYIYYNEKYDLPTTIRRMERHGLDTRVFTKDNSKPKVSKDSVHVEGCVIYDPYIDIKGDQSLNGETANRGLKAVSDYFGFKAEVEPLNFFEEPVRKLIGTEKLKMYNIEDVKRLLLLFDVYFPNVQTSAEKLQIPLSLAIGLNRRDLGLIVLGEEFKKRNIISDGLNKDRFPEIFQREEVLGKEVSAYQGALSNIKRYGLFKPIIKADASSMYPNIMSHFNLSHDTTQIIDYKKYEKDGFKVVEKEDCFVYYIPDDKIGKIVVVRVFKKEGFTTKLVKQFLNNREKYKKKYKETDKKEYKALSDIEKVKANGGIYGIQGNARHPFGHVGIALTVTGIAREAIKCLIVALEELYPDSVIEWDTDGVYFTTEEFDEIDVWVKFDKKIKEKFEQDIVLDIGYDHYDKGYFHLTKNYVLKKRNVVELTGVSMKNAKFCPMERNLTMDFAKAKLGELNEQEVIQYYKNLNNFKQIDFAMKTSLGKSIKSYVGQARSTLSYRLAVDAQHLLNIPPEEGNEYYYVKTIHGYELLQAPDKASLDIDYYMKKIDKIIKRFKSKHVDIKSLSNFYDAKDTKQEIDDWEFDEKEEEVEKNQKEEDSIAKLSNFY